MWHGYFKLVKNSGFSLEDKQELKWMGDQTPTEPWHKTVIRYRLNNTEAICEMKLNSEPQASNFAMIGIDDFSILGGGTDSDGNGCSVNCCQAAVAYLIANQAQWYEDPY